MTKLKEIDEIKDQGTDSDRSSFFGGLDVVDYGYKKTKAAGIAAYAVRSLLEVIRDHTSIGAVSRCFPYYRSYIWPPMASARYQTGQTFLNKCDNKNACVVCSRANDAKIRKEFSEQFDGFTGQGYEPFWQTFDIGFKTNTSSLARIKITGLFWRKLSQNTKYRRLIGKKRVVGLRVTEFEYQRDSQDWTPHYHVVWLFHPEMKQSEIGDFMDYTSTFWRGKQNNHQNCSPNNKPLHYRKLDPSSTRPIAHYLFKAFYIEIHGSQVKLPRKLKTPVHYALDYGMNGDLDSLDIWIKYEATSRNARRFTFTSNWRNNSQNELRYI
jgi:hypothetical protein